MTRTFRTSRTSMAAVWLAGFGVSGTLAGRAAAEMRQPEADHQCDVDLTNPGMMKDIVSNALMQGLGRKEAEVNAFLAGAETTYSTGSELLRAAAAKFGVDEAALAAQVERFKHDNCPTGAKGAPAGAPLAEAATASKFARDVTLHVVLHEMGHALIREFDIPVLANEETTADAFATYYLTTYLPDRAPDVLAARVTSLMIEAGESQGVDWSGEHDHDGRRAYQIAALAIAADAEKYRAVGALVGMSEDDIADAKDYGGEIRRSWRRVLAPLWMPPGQASSEAAVSFESESAFVSDLCSGGFAGEVEAALRRFDWHSQVRVRFIEGDGGAGWSRSSRTITVNSAYVRRFVGQGERAAGK